MKCTLTLGNNRIVTFDCVEHKGGVVVEHLGDARRLSTNEAVAVSFIARIVEMLTTGVSISHNFNPETQDQQFEVIKCQWTEHGYLRIVDERPPHRYRHAETPAEALKRKRNFTCTRAVHAALPKRRMLLPRS